MGDGRGEDGRAHGKEKGWSREVKECGKNGVWGGLIEVRGRWREGKCKGKLGG